MVNKKRLLDEFLELVQITCSTRNERQIADVLTKRLQNLGFAVIEDNAGEKIGGNTGNLIATLKGNPSLPKIFFSAHMDCVEPCANIKPQIKDGVITSDGTTILGSDDKSGIAPILEAIRVIQEEKMEHGDLQVIFTVAEEGGLNGSKNLEQQYLTSDFGYCLDSSGRPGKVIVQAPGQDKLVIQIHGKTAHAGLAPEEGINAIVLAGKACATVKEGRIDEETTANIGIIKGGRANNIVPDFVEIVAESRSRNPQKLSKQTDYMVDTFKKVVAENGGRAEVEVIHAYAPYTLTEDSHVVKNIVKAMRAIAVEPTLASTGGGSDGNLFNLYGVPCCTLGTGMTKAHTTEEYIIEEDLYKVAEIILSVVQNSK